MSTIIRLAMWSGPRNISTALLRAFGNRPDAVVVDEPLYAHYLDATGLAHPGAAEVISHHEADWRAVVRELSGPLPAGRTLFYQKHMAHHLLAEIERDWLDGLTHAFLIREPRAMLLSLDKVTPNPRLEDTGLPQQVEIFRREVERTGRTPPVLDARDVLEDPRARLGELCDAVGLPFLEEMLAWPAGKRQTDGIWSKHWYAAVERTTGFAPYTERDEALPAALEPLADVCQPYYEELAAHRLGLR